MKLFKMIGCFMALVVALTQKEFDAVKKLANFDPKIADIVWMKAEDY
jgi:hypothetical protein